MTNAEWPAIVRMLVGIAKVLPEELRSPIVAVVLPLLHDVSIAPSCNTCLNH